MSLVLAEGRRALTDLVIEPDSDRVVRFAARELGTFLRRMSGAAFPLVEREAAPSRRARPAIVIRVRPGAQPGGADPDAFTLDVRRDGALIEGDKGRSALYGVYAFLERLGCRFVEPGLDVVPAAARLAAPAGRRTETAAFRLRTIFRVHIFPSKTAAYPGLDPGHHLPQIDWMAKRRLNHYAFYVDYFRYDLWEQHKHKVLGALLDRGFEIEVAHHSIHYFCPPDEALDYGRYGPATYRIRHPDWYAGHQTRIGRPDVQAVVGERFLAYARRNPELGFIGLWPADAAVRPPVRGLGVTDGYVKFWNAMARALAAECPGKRLSILAYYALLHAPRRVAPAPNLHAWFCPIDSNYHYPMSDGRLSRNFCRISKTRQPNRLYLSLLKRWIDRMPPGQACNFEYYGWTPALTPLVGKMRRDLAAYRDLSLGGVYAWAGFTYNLMGAEYRWARDLAVLPGLLWNPDADPAAAEAGWAAGVFGRAGGEILDVYRLLEQTHAREAARGLLAKPPWIPLDVLRRAQAVLAKARRRADAPGARRRIDLLEQTACRACTERVYRRIGDWDQFL